MVLLFYISELIETIFIGKYIPHLTNSINYMAILIPLWMISRIYPQGEVLTVISYYGMMIVTGHLLTNILRLYSERNDNYALLIGEKFLSIIIYGLLTGLIIRDTIQYASYEVQPDLVSGLSWLVIISSIIAAVFSLAVFFESSENPFVSSLSRRINITPLENFVRVFGILVYLYFGRDYLDEFLAENNQYLPYLEWGIISLIAILSFRDLRSYVAEDLTQADVMGKWKTHFQRIEESSDYNIDILSKSVKDFIDKGEKDILLVYLINMLTRNNSSRFYTPKALKELIYYKPKDLELITFRWNREKAEKHEVEKRKEIIEKILHRVEELTYKNYSNDVDQDIIIRGDTI